MTDKKWGDYKSRVEFFELLMMANNHLDEDEIGFEIRALQPGKTRNIVTSIYITPELLYPENKKEFFNVLSPILTKNAKYGANVYFGPNPRIKPFDCKKGKYSIECKQGSRKTVANKVRILYLDIDILHKEDVSNVEAFENFLCSRKNRELLENAMRDLAMSIQHLLEKEGLYPFATIHSGFGIQFLFALKNPIDKKDFQYWNKSLADRVNKILSDNKITFDPSTAGIPANVVRGRSNYLQVDEKVQDVARIMRLPYTRNWRYGVPAFTNLLYPEDPAEFEIPFMDNSVLSEDIKVVKEKMKSRKKIRPASDVPTGEVPMITKYSWTASVILGDRAKKALYDFLKEYYTPGQRHNIVLRLAGLLRAYGYRPDGFVEIAYKVYQESGDEDSFSDRVRAIEDTYIRDPKIISWSPIPAIEENLKQQYGTKKDGSLRSEGRKVLEKAWNDYKALKKVLREDVEKAEKEGRIAKPEVEVDEDGNVYVD